MHPVTHQRPMQACGLLLSLLVAPAWAQTAAEASARAPTEQRRAEERQLQQLEALQRGAEVWGTPDVPLPALHWPEHEAPCVPVRHIALTGAESDRFQFVLQDLVAGADPAVGRCLGTEGVSIAVARAQRRLTARGFTTSRILLEPQNLSQGTLRLSLLPGRISAIRFADGTSPRATQLNAVPVRVGDILNLRDIEQALENLRRMPTVEADIQIVPGKGPAESELVLRWRQALPLRLNLSLDDSGTRATGRYQLSATLSADHWWTLNDLFYLTQGRDLGGGEPGARGTRNTSLYYSLPLGYWALGFNASRYSYFQSVAGLYQDYRYSGSGAQQDITLSRLVHRDGASKTTLQLKAFARQSRNFIDDTEIEVQRRATGGCQKARDAPCFSTALSWSGQFHVLGQSESDRETSKDQDHPLPRWPGDRLRGHHLHQRRLLRPIVSSVHTGGRQTLFAVDRFAGPHLPIEHSSLGRSITGASREALALALRQAIPGIRQAHAHWPQRDQLT